MEMRIIDSGKASAATHMKKDRQLFDELKADEVILHLYEWESPFSLTYGHFMRKEKFLVANAESQGLDAAVRPSGGGFVFHHSDYAFSLLMSATHPQYASTVLTNYHTVNSLVVKVLKQVFHLNGCLAEQDEAPSLRVSGNFCMAKTSKYDVLLQGKKVGGAAQRKSRQGFLHQGSLFLSGSSKEFYQKFLLPTVVDEVVEEIEKHAFFPLGIEPIPQELSQARKDVKETFIQLFCCGEL
ncbi:lipoyl protein ligase domain-containing protein [Candidatus Chlamydia sanziniae]|uniref:Lipoate-protein ligase A n=1 Tax=Candidatus Chlamydia sanziniae TaxID=1806891 RepID=A0A1A9HVZ4_9CHLA|nr:biotin--protein ligase [Candidatus Chlamydia sanziniae]ANH79169.1 Lipoate-protein ligase A [Candidatus Chlamydia sanziniae]